MKIRRPLLTSVLAALLLLSMGPMPAPIYMNVPLDETLKTSVKLSQAVLCDGSVRLEAGLYDLKIRSLGDGSVRATFTGNGKTGQATGKVQGHDGIIIQGGRQPGAANAIVVEGGKAPSFATLGFTPQSLRSFHTQGNHLNVIVNGQGTNQILIGLLLPAVQKVVPAGGIIAPTDLQGSKIQPNAAGEQKVQPAK